MLTNLFWVAFGSAIGASLRYLITYGFMYLSQPFGHDEVNRQSTYWAILSINLSGCFLIGTLTSFFLLESSGKLINTNSVTWLFLCVGVLGGYTTFSSFGLHVIEFFQEQRIWAGMIYIAISFMGSIAFAIGGLYVGRFIVMHL